MAKPTAPIDICKLAMDHLGEDTSGIVSIEAPTSTNEELLQRHYDQERRAALRQYVWNFAKKRALLSRIGTPAFDFADQYQLPNDCLRVVSIGETELSPIQNYDIQGRTILVDNSGATSLKLRYIYDSENVPEWDPLFIQYFSLTLALAVGYKGKQKKSIIDAITTKLVQVEGKAVQVDGQERVPRRIERSPALDARRYGAKSYDQRYYNFSNA